MTEELAAAGPSHRAAEIGVAVVIAAFGALVIGGSLKAGIGWGAEGPRSGFFPFYVGLAIVAASGVNLVRAVGARSAARFAEWTQLRQVALITVPTAVYVVAIPWAGIYLASIVLIAGFMIRLGAYRPLVALATAVVVMVVVFATFELWFLVALPKGPIEELLGL